jgi:hypothetical protein
VVIVFVAPWKAHGRRRAIFVTQLGYTNFANDHHLRRWHVQVQEPRARPPTHDNATAISLVEGLLSAVVACAALAGCLAE